jgi:hypothetical protein
MKTIVTRSLLAAATLALAGTALADQPVRVRTDGLPTHMRDRIEAAAQQGPVALRQYLERTRMMGYQLRMEEVAANVDLVGVVAKSPDVVKKEQKLATR